MRERRYKTHLLYRRIGKRVADLATAIPLLILLSPLLFLVAVLVRFRLGAPILFRQKRPLERTRPSEHIAQSAR